MGPIFGEESGLGVTEAFPDLGNNSSFLRASWGVGGVELVADPQKKGLQLRGILWITKYLT